MSDDVSIYGDDGREYHSRFDLGLELAAMETIKWLVLGHLFFLVGLALTLLLRVEGGAVWITPLFGLPLLWAGRKHRQWGRILVFTAGFTAMHYLAVLTASQNYAGMSPVTGNMLMPGLLGGAIGSAGALGLCAVFKLLREGAPTLVLAGFGVLLLAAAGSVSVYLFLTTGGDGTGFASRFTQMVWIYSPWQLLFAYVLAKTLEPIDG